MGLGNWIKEKFSRRPKEVYESTESSQSPPDFSQSRKAASTAVPPNIEDATLEEERKKTELEDKILSDLEKRKEESDKRRAEYEKLQAETERIIGETESRKVTEGEKAKALRTARVLGTIAGGTYVASKVAGGVTKAIVPTTSSRRTEIYFPSRHLQTGQQVQSPAGQAVGNIGYGQLRQASTFSQKGLPHPLAGMRLPHPSTRPNIPSTMPTRPQPTGPLGQPTGQPTRVPTIIAQAQTQAEPSSQLLAYMQQRGETPIMSYPGKVVYWIGTRQGSEEGNRENWVVQLRTGRYGFSGIGDATGQPRSKISSSSIDENELFELAEKVPQIHMRRR